MKRRILAARAQRCRSSILTWSASVMRLLGICAPVQVEPSVVSFRLAADDQADSLPSAAISDAIAGLLTRPIDPTGCTCACCCQSGRAHEWRKRLATIYPTAQERSRATKGRGTSHRIQRKTGLAPVRSLASRPGRWHSRYLGISQTSQFVAVQKQSDLLSRANLPIWREAIER